MTVRSGVLERADAAVALRDALHPQKRLCVVHPAPPEDETLAEKWRRGDLVRGAGFVFWTYWFSFDWPMISCAVKLIPQVGKELPTKKLSDWSGK